MKFFRNSIDVLWSFKRGEAGLRVWDIHEGFGAGYGTNRGRLAGYDARFGNYGNYARFEGDWRAMKADCYDAESLATLFESDSMNHPWEVDLEVYYLIMPEGARVFYSNARAY